MKVKATVNYSVASNKPQVFRFDADGIVGSNSVAQFGAALPRKSIETRTLVRYS